MPTVSEYARKRGVSHQYISKLVKKGLPLDSYEAADRWIRVNASSKAPTNPKQIARVVGEDNNGSKTHLRGEELPEHQIGKRSTTSLDSLHDALEVAVFAQEETFCLLTKAIAESTDSKIAVLFAKHNKALKIWLEADTRYREALEDLRNGRPGELIRHSETQKKKPQPNYDRGLI
jgi:hypothetical protein